MTHTCRYHLAVPMILAITGLGGCDKITPNGSLGTISLLKDGSERVCVAADVQQALRGLIVPKADELGEDGSSDDAVKASKTVSLAFDTTTLQATDKSVNKASCTTNVRIAGAGESRKFRINYDVSPSAEDPNQVVVSGDTDDARAFAKLEIGNALTSLQDARRVDASVAQEAAIHEQLLATITPKWLAGVWIATGASAEDCGNGQALIFRANHVVEGIVTGRWTLSADQLHAVGQGANGGADINGTISAADPLSFTLDRTDGGTFSARRCTREEIQSYTSSKLPDSFEPAPPAQN